MEWRPTSPAAPPESIGDLQEVFDHPYYLGASAETRQAVRLASSGSKFSGENRYPWDNYFELPLSPWLTDKDVLDLGCFNGGRTVAWNERYGFRSFAGVDVRPDYVEAARAFAASQSADGRFLLGFGERLPFEKAEFDAIVTFDVFEHVRSVEATLAECRRVLRPGGALIAVFPGYFQPNEHHLGLVTRTPGLQLLFSGATLVQAYAEILTARGEAAAWYRRDSPRLASWERGHTLNGITFRQFQRLIDPIRWRTISISRKPIGSVGRNAEQWPTINRIARAMRPLTYVPGIQEILLHRIAVILEKRVVGGRG